MNWMNRMNRAQAVAVVDNLYGCPGEHNETAESDALLLRVIKEFGFNALMDRAVIRLAEIHMEHEAQKTANGGT